MAALIMAVICLGFASVLLTLQISKLKQDKRIWNLKKGIRS